MPEQSIRSFYAEKRSWSKGKRTRGETVAPLDRSIPTLFLFLLGESGYATRRSKIEEGAVIVDEATTECDQLIRLLGIARGMRRDELASLLAPIFPSVFFPQRIKPTIGDQRWK